MKYLVIVSYSLMIPLVHLLPTQQEKKFNLEAVDNGYLFEGDMVLPISKIKTAIGGGDTDYQRHVFGLRKSTRYRWPGGKVPYVLSSSVKNPILGKYGPTVVAIRSAMKEWEEKTCVRFVERTNEKDYIEFIDGGYRMCYSHVGRTGGKQQISIGFACFTHSIVLHEIGHALGLHHEQSRPDRDNYVEIIWDNIKTGEEHNFHKYTHSNIDSRGSPYDYHSIMHYEWNEFAKWPWLTTIRAKKSGVSIGSEGHLTAQDTKQINAFYGCQKG